MTLFNELKPNCFFCVDDSVANIVTADNYWDETPMYIYKWTIDLSLIGINEVEFNYNSCRAYRCYSINGYPSLFGHSTAIYADMVMEFLKRQGFDTYTDTRNWIAIKYKKRGQILQIPVSNYGSGRYIIVEIGMKDYVKKHYGNTKLLSILKKSVSDLRFPFGAKKYFLRILNAKTQIEAAIALLEFEAQLTKK